MRDLLIANSQPGGGAVGGRIIGYSIGGKSGTARKLEGRAYVANKHRALFMGFAPGHSPKVIVAVMIDEPSAGNIRRRGVRAGVLSGGGRRAARAEHRAGRAIQQHFIAGIDPGSGGFLRS